MTQSRRLIIVGNGGAAVHAVRAARAAGHQGPIHMISDAAGPAFNPMLAPYFLAGKIPFEACFPFGKDFYEDHHVTCDFGVPVAALDALNREICLGNNKRIFYDRCLVATGASPILPKIPGLRHSPRIFSLRTPRDTIRLHATLARAKKALILGASMIGIKLAQILMDHGMTVTIAEVAERVLSSAAHPVCSSFLARKIREKSVDLRLGCTLDHIDEGAGKLACHFTDDRSLETDLCLVAAGVHANTGFLDPCQVALDEGILVNERLESSAPGLYAAGDVSQGPNPVSGGKKLIGLWDNACCQGRTAGANMAGDDTLYLGTIPHHVSTFFGVTFLHLGDVHRRGDHVRILTNRTSVDGTFHVLVFDRAVLVGVNSLNAVQNAGMLKSAIMQKLHWSDDLNLPLENPTQTQIERILTSLRTPRF